MTETVVAQRNTVSASGFSNPLTLAANVEEATHVKVYADNTLLDSDDYELDGVGDTGDLDEIVGIEVTLDSAVLAGDWTTYTVEHDPPMDQGADLSSGGVLGRVYENALDAIMRRIQALRAYLDRSLRLPPDVTGVSITLPAPVARRGLVWNAAGTALINTSEDPDSEKLTATLAAQEAAEAAQAAAEDAEATATTQADNAATSAAAAAQSALDAAAAAGDVSAVLAALEAAKLPVGSSFMFNGTSAPTGGLKENGAAVSRTTYAALFAVIGTTFGVGDGSTTFNLPESRAEFIRGLDDSRGIDSGRTISSAQAEEVGPHTHPAEAASGGAHTHGITRPVRNWSTGGDTSSSSGWDGGAYLVNSSYTHNTNSGGAHSHTITVSANSGSENRPRNVAKLMCIKY